MPPMKNDILLMDDKAKINQTLINSLPKLSRRLSENRRIHCPT